MRGTVLWASTALLAAGCTTYKPIDQGSQVPWADALATRRAALVQPQPQAGPRDAMIRTASLPRDTRAEPTATSSGGGAGAIRISPLASEPTPAVEDRRSSDVEAVEVETVEVETVEVAAVEPAATVPDTHTVAKGEWLLGLARQYEVDPKALAAANGLQSPYNLRPGQVLTIPKAGQETVVAVVETTTLAEPEPVAASPSPDATYVVQKGDALGAIARRHGLSTRELAAANDLVAPYPLRPGQELSVPEHTTTTEVAAVLPTEPAQEPAPAVDTSGFLWPVDGKVIARFGDEKDGESRSGIAIEARKGAPVKAAQRGVVVYAGDAIRGYGRMILLRHDDGYVTAYGHNSALLVNVGATVERGQVIARVGDTGGVPTPQLHFEVRKGKQPIDPETVLASRGGQITG